MPQPRQGRPTKAKELWLAKDPFLHELQLACHLASSTQNLSVTDQERQAEDSFFRAAVALETFLSDWLARCLRFDTTKVTAAAKRAAEQQLSQQLSVWAPENKVLARTLEKYPPSGQVAVTVTIPKTVSIARARELLGVVDDNRSFASAQSFREWAGRYLADQRARATSNLTAQHDAVLDATIAIRNVLAHRSKRSQTALSATLRSARLPAALRVQQTVTAAKVGRYLRVERQGRPRFKGYFEHLADVANTLAPYQGRPRVICP